MVSLINVNSYLTAWMAERNAGLVCRRSGVKSRASQLTRRCKQFAKLLQHLSKYSCIALVL